MLDILDLTMMRSLAREQRGEALFPVRQSERPQILAVFEQHVEDEVDEILRSAFGECRLQCREIRCAVVVEGHDLAIDDAVWEVGSAFGDRSKLRRPVQAL